MIKTLKNLWENVCWEISYNRRQVKAFFISIKNARHKVKHGWSVEDTWNVDDSIPSFCSNVLGGFAKTIEDELVLTDDINYCKILKAKLKLTNDIKKGFDDFLWFENELVHLYLCEEMTKKEYNKLKKQTTASFQKSLKIMGDNLGKLWW